jgi:hypothetical protein
MSCFSPDAFEGREICGLYAGAGRMAGGTMRINHPEESSTASRPCFHLRHELKSEGRRGRFMSIWPNGNGTVPESDDVQAHFA